MLFTPWTGLAVMTAAIAAAVIHQLCAGTFASFVKETAFCIPLINLFGWVSGKSDPYSYVSFVEVLVCCLLMLVLQGRKDAKQLPTIMIGFWNMISAIFSAVVVQYLPLIFGVQTLGETAGEVATILRYVATPMFIYVAILFFLYVSYELAASFHYVVIPTAAIILPSLVMIELGAPAYLFEVCLVLSNIFSCFWRGYQEAKNKEDVAEIDLLQEDDDDGIAFAKLMIITAIPVVLAAIFIGVATWKYKMH